MKGTMLEPFEASFAGALLDAERPIPRGITAYNAAIPTRRFAVYRNNVVAGLVKALKSRFPVVEKIVGQEFFAAMARVLWRSGRRARRCLRATATNLQPSSPHSSRRVSLPIL